ncbi:hypothetical protein GCM10009867_35100 [Pedococcus aerophilus]|uniref:Glycosyltransferase 2-like domain-containing protein n=1 Tax=Pedococcus aerophilus TaxID=436356 RepID=A0ABN3UX99_9MICO
MSQLAQPGAVVMAVHRPDRGLLRRQVLSLQRQQAERWSCIVGIDGHDPETHAYVSDLVEGDTRFVVHHFDENLGVYRHFERLLGLVDTRVVSWVALADQDDEWYPDKLSLLAPLLSRPGVTAAVGRARVVAGGDATGTTRRRVGGLASSLLVNHVTGSLAVFRPEVVAASLPFPPGNRHAIHDHWLGVCAASLGQIVQADDVVQDYVQHSGNVIGDSGRHTVGDALTALRESGGPLRLVDEHVGGRWAWRVQMARAVRDRQVAPATVPVIEAVATGRAAKVITGAVLRAVRRREVTVVEAVALLAASARWRHTATSRDPG